MALRGMSAVLVPATQMVHIVSVWVIRSNNVVNQTNIQAALKKKSKETCKGGQIICFEVYLICLKYTKQPFLFLCL